METTCQEFQTHYRYISHVIDFLTAFQDGRRILEQTSQNSINKLFRSLRMLRDTYDYFESFTIWTIIQIVQKIQKAQMIQKVQMTQKTKNLGGRLRRNTKKLTTVLWSSLEMS